MYLRNTTVFQATAQLYREGVQIDIQTTGDIHSLRVTVHMSPGGNSGDGKKKGGSRDVKKHMDGEVHVARESTVKNNKNNKLGSRYIAKEAENMGEEVC